MAKFFGSLCAYSKKQDLHDGTRPVENVCDLGTLNILDIFANNPELAVTFNG